MATKMLGSVLLSNVFIFTLLVVLKRTPYINAFTHWVVTEEGKIQAQVNVYYIQQIKLVYFLRVLISSMLFK